MSLAASWETMTTDHSHSPRDNCQVPGATSSKTSLETCWGLIHIGLDADLDLGHADLDLGICSVQLLSLIQIGRCLRPSL